jgi:hypothetical protein
MMTIGEFKAWLDGYSASFNEAPDEWEWSVIKEKLATVKEEPLKCGCSEMLEKWG